MFILILKGKSARTYSKFPTQRPGGGRQRLGSSAGWAAVGTAAGASRARTAGGSAAGDGGPGVMGGGGRGNF